MAHPTDAAMVRYALSRLRGGGEPDFDEHVRVCLPCRARLSAQDDVVSVFRFGFSSSPSRASRLTNHLSYFKTHLPLISLEAEAGGFGTQQEVELEGWVEVPSDSILTKDMFVTHVKGHSMEPRVPDGSLCAFRSDVPVPYNGKVLLLEKYGEDGGNRYTVSQYRTSKNVEPHREGDGAWLHEPFTLEPLNPEFPPWDVGSDEKVNVIGEFAFIVQSHSTVDLGLVS